MTMCMLGGDGDDDYGTTTFASNMELRDYFAAKIIQASYIRNNLADAYMDKMAETAYQYADAMMKARNQ